MSVCVAICVCVCVVCTVCRCNYPAGEHVRHNDDLSICLCLYVCVYMSVCMSVCVAICVCVCVVCTVCRCNYPTGEHVRHNDDSREARSAGIVCQTCSADWWTSRQKQQLWSSAQTAAWLVTLSLYHLVSWQALYLVSGRLAISLGPTNVRGPRFSNAKKLTFQKTKAILQCLCFLGNAVRIWPVIIIGHWPWVCNSDISSSVWPLVSTCPL